MKLAVLLLFTFVILQTKPTHHTQSDQMRHNYNTIWSSPLKFIKKSQYGKLYQIGQGTTKMKLVHVYGTMYEMGYAQGQLLKEDLNLFLPELWTYIQNMITDSFPKQIPIFLQKNIASGAIGAALDLTYRLTKRYTNNKYYKQMKGIADASGVDFKTLRRIHMIGQVTKGHCSMFGAWGTATKNGQTVQLRALDWDFDGPYRKYPVTVVYHPTLEKDGHAWLNIGFSGWIGVLSGVSSKQMAISQIGVSYPDDSFGKQSRIGNAFTFLLRDILQFDNSLNDSIHRMNTTRRTCNLILGVGDGKTGQFRGFQYGHSVFNVVSDTNLIPVQDWHPPLENIVYWGMDWIHPTVNKRLSDLLIKYRGQITAQLTATSILPNLRSGNLQTAIYDLTNEQVYFAYGYVSPSGQKINAYDRPYINLDLKSIFAQKL